MAKICFYCGNEIENGGRCNCRNANTSSSQTASNKSGTNKANNNSNSSGTNDSKTNSNSSGSNAKNNNTKTNYNSTANANNSSSSRKEEKDQERKAKERARGQERSYRESQRAAQKASRPKFDWRSFLIKIMTSQGFSKNDSLPQKIGYSLLQSFLRPVAAAENFLRQNDITVSVFYVVLFSVSCGFVALKFYPFSILMLLQAIILGLVVAAALNGICLLVFRFLAKLKFDIRQILSAFSVPALFMSVFFMFAASGSASIISIVISITLGFVAGALLHLVSLKALTKQGTEQIVVQVMFIYVLFSAVLGIIINLIMPVASKI